jgi:hypothetical protein
MTVGHGKSKFTRACRKQTVLTDVVGCAIAGSAERTAAAANMPSSERGALVFIVSSHETRPRVPFLRLCATPGCGPLWQAAAGRRGRGSRRFERHNLPSAHQLYERTGHSDAAIHHRDLSRVTMLQLAQSLPAAEPRRHAFLAAPAVAKVLGDAKHTSRSP